MDKKDKLKERFQKRMTKHNLLTLLLKNLYVDGSCVLLHVPSMNHDYDLICKYLAMYEMTKKGKKNER